MTSIKPRQESVVLGEACEGCGYFECQCWVPLEPPTHSGDQAHADVRAPQLRPENYSPAMVEKAARLLTERSYAEVLTHPGQYDVRGDSGEVYRLRVIETRSTWFVTCTCPARASRWNRAGACAHRVLAGWLRARTLRQQPPRWPALNLEAWS